MLVLQSLPTTATDNRSDRVIPCSSIDPAPPAPQPSEDVRRLGLFDADGRGVAAAHRQRLRAGPGGRCQVVDRAACAMCPGRGWEGAGKGWAGGVGQRACNGARIFSDGTFDTKLWKSGSPDSFDVCSGWTLRLWKFGPVHLKQKV